MRTVILVGAGATLADAIPRRPSRSQRPPLDATFFELCRVADLAGRVPVRQYMRRTYDIDPFRGEYRMEEVFNYIYSDAFSAEPPDGCLNAYWALIRMYTRAIGRTTNRSDGTSRYGVGALLRYLWCGDPLQDITIVTFNQDLVIEKAIQSASDTSRYSSIPWSIKVAYETQFGTITKFGPHGQAFDDDEEDSSIRVLKLHGSLNWFYKVRSGSDPRNSLRSPSGDLLCLNDRTVYSSLRYHTGSRYIDIIPLVIPPIYEKASRYQQAVAPIWIAADHAIRAADRVIVFGYSFPDIDFAAKSLFRRCAHGNPSLDEIHVIDVDRHMASRAAAVFSVSAFHHYANVPAFVSRSRLYSA